VNIHYLPKLNAILNTTAFLLLLGGWWAIKRGRRQLHPKLMTGALISSIVFLASYLTYHAVVGVTRYPGEGISRIFYFFILGTHTPLAIVIVPFIVKAIWYACKKEFVKHTQITRWLLPVWMYVSVTGVVIYLMLYVFKS